MSADAPLTKLDDSWEDDHLIPKAEYERLITHFYVMQLYDDATPTAIGEAAFVRRLGPQKWSARVVEWSRHPMTNEYVRNPVVFPRIVKGPVLSLVPKKEFKGHIPECCKHLAPQS